MNWFPMDMASRTGWPIIYLRRLQIWRSGRPLEYKYEIKPLVRHGADEESEGYWRSAACSVPDHEIDMSRGWWCYTLPVNPDGTIKLPDDFHTAKLPERG